MTRVLAAIIVPPHLSASGGARAARALTEAMAQQKDAAGLGCVGFDMTIATMSGVDQHRPGRANTVAVRTWLPVFVRLLPRKLRSLFYRSDIPQIIAGGQWDIVHLHNPMPALEMQRVARACKRVGVPYVVSTHGFNEISNGAWVYGFGRIKRTIWRALVQGPVASAVRGAACVFALSPADIAIVRGFGFQGPIVIVPNGVETEAAIGDKADRQIWNRFDILPSERFAGLTCMFLGNHTPNKGVPVLLEAFAGLTFPFQLIVGGEKRDGIDYASVENACKPDQRAILTGRLSDTEVGALLRRADLFVFPTLADTFPLVVLEAMAQGCAVLASDVGGISYQLQGGCGELVKAGDVAELREAITRFANQPERLASMQLAAKARVDAEFSWAAAAMKGLEGYLQLLGPASAPLAASLQHINASAQAGRQTVLSPP